MKKNIFYFLTLALILVSSGCVARTYPLTRDRVDQDLESGNRGYLTGKPMVDTLSNRKETRTVRVFEIELGRTYKSKKLNTVDNTALRGLPSAGATGVNENIGDTSAAGLTLPNASAKQYTVAKNDTLQKISQKFYGTTKKWVKIYAANKDLLKGPDKVYPGQVLIIPDASKAADKQYVLTEPEANLK